MYNLKQTPRLNLEELHAFLVVAQTGSFSMAADFLHRTTAAISHRIKMLEEGMGIALIERTTRSFKLTPAGEMLLEKASQIFELQRNISEELQQIADGIEPRFTIVFNNLLYDANGAAALLTHLGNTFEFTTFKIVKAVYMGVWDAMRYGDGHFAIGVPGFHSINDDFQAEPLGVIRWVMVTSPDHPLAQQTGPASMEVLRMYPVINIEDTSLQLQKRLPWRLAGQRELIVPDMETKIQCHIKGLGVGFLPCSLALPLISQGLLTEIPWAQEYRSPSPFAIAWPKNGTGKIQQYLHAMFASGDALLEPLLSRLSPSEEGLEEEEA